MRRVGTDAIWNEGNDNPALFYLEKLIRKENAALGGPERLDGDVESEKIKKEAGKGGCS